MRTLLVLAVLLLAHTDSRAEPADAPKRTMPHQEKCAVALPADFWDDLGDERSHIRESEQWAWNERICLGFWADMRHAPGGRGEDEVCAPAKSEETEESALAHRELRSEFLELILSHEPWISVPRRPTVGIKCALVRGNIRLADHEIVPSFLFHESEIQGEVTLVGTEFKRTFSLNGSAVTGKLQADRMEVGHGLFLRNGSFADIDLLGAEIAGSADFDSATVTGKLQASRMEVGHGLFLRNGSFVDIDLLGSEIAGDADFESATVTGKLKADGMEVGRNLYPRKGSFADIDLLSVKIVGNASFNGATITGKLQASRMEVGRDMVLGNGSFADVDLLGAEIAGNASFSGATVTGKLKTDGMEVGRSLFLRNGSFADIDLLGVEIASNADFDGATVTGKLKAEGMEVGRNLFLRNGSFADIDLLSVEIASNADFDGATVELRAEGMEVGRSLFLRNGTFARIALLTGRIGGNIQGGTFAGELDLTGTAIGGEIHLSSGWLKKSPVWRDGAALILRNARANALQARQKDWSISGGDGLLPTELTGFTYSRLEGLDTAGGKGMGDESADWLIGWIEAQRDHGANYDPRPYTQLAGILEAAGATDKAKAIRYAKFKHKQEYDESMNRFRRALLLIEQIFVGFGVYPLLALAWFAGLVVFGSVVAQWSNDKSVRRWSGLWYSLENALPLIETNERFKSVVHGRPYLVHFFHFQKAFGFFLATILVGALTLLSG